MPLEWRQSGAAPEGVAPVAQLRLWPHRSLDARGFVTFIGATFSLSLVPLLAVVGTVALWVLLPFLMAALCMIWIALRASSAQASLTKTLTLSRDRISLERREPKGDVRRWEADPHWISVDLHREGGPVENYVTLRGGAREVEIGAFLSPEERLVLRDDLMLAMDRLLGR